jgi:hypothetical protein
MVEKMRVIPSRKIVPWKIRGILRYPKRTSEKYQIGGMSGNLE